MTTEAPMTIVEVFRTDESGSRILSIFQISSECSRVIVDADCLHGEVWGFVRDGSGREFQVEGEFLERKDGVLMS